MIYRQKNLATVLLKDNNKPEGTMSTKHVTIRFPLELVTRIKAKAEKENRSFGNCVLTILINYFKKEK